MFYYCFIRSNNSTFSIHFGDGSIDGVKDAIGQFQHIYPILNRDRRRGVVDNGAIKAFQFHSQTQGGRWQYRKWC